MQLMACIEDIRTRLESDQYPSTEQAIRAGIVVKIYRSEIMSEKTVASYEFTELELTKCEFFNLVFMNAPPDWKERAEENEFLMCICGKSLKEVVEKVRKKSSYSGDDPTEVFRNIDVVPAGKKKSWFDRHATISQNFDKDRMGELWIRNLSDYFKNGERVGERKECSTGSFYADDGNGRALVYAMHVSLRKVTYEPVKAIHATSWDIATGILKFLPQSASVLEHEGKLQCEQFLKKKFQLPIGIEIKTYKRA